MEIQEIKRQLTLRAVLDYYGLKPDKHMRLQCPFHADTTPSLQVYYKTHTAYCFSANCKTSGRLVDVIDFVMYMEGITKHGAIEKCKELTRKVTATGGDGTANPVPTRPHSLNALSRTAVLTKMFTYFKNAVYNSGPAQAYLKRRGLDWEKLEIGYNSGQFHHGERKEEALIRSCLELGLLIPGTRRSRTGQEAYIPFAKYGVCFALRNEAGAVSGLYFRSTVADGNDGNGESAGGNVSNDKNGNPRHPSRHYYLKDRSGLYPGWPGLDTKRLILTESVIDAATLLQQGDITNEYTVVASYGTNGFTGEHEAALKRLKSLEEVVLAFDGDEAGRTGAGRICAVVLKIAPQTKITRLSIPEGEDINSLLQGHDGSVFSHLLSQRQPFFLSNEGLPDNLVENSIEKKETGESPNGLPQTHAEENERIEGSETDRSILNTAYPDRIVFVRANIRYAVMGELPKSMDQLKVALCIENLETGMVSRVKVDLYEDRLVRRSVAEAAKRLGVPEQTLTQDLAELTRRLDASRQQRGVPGTANTNTNKNVNAASGDAANKAHATRNGAVRSTIDSTGNTVPADASVTNASTPSPHHSGVPSPLTAKERAEAEVFLRSPNLMGRISELLSGLGIVGETNARQLLWLVALSHKTSSPLHAVVQGSTGSGKTRLLRQISDSMPQETTTRLTRVSEKVLYNFPEHFFVNRLVCLEDLDGLGEEAEYAFRELQSSGELVSAMSIKREDGTIASAQKVVRGPMASLACTTRAEWYEDNMSRVFVVAVDESGVQTARILDYLNARASGEIDNEREEKAKRMLKLIARAIAPYAVVNPHAGRIALPREAHKIRRLHGLFLGLVEIITLVHQYQRRRDEKGRLVVQAEDLETAVCLLMDSIVLKVDELDGPLRQFYERLKGWLEGGNNGGSNSNNSKDKYRTFTRFEVRAAVGLAKTQQHQYMQRLVELEYLQQYGHANRGYQYKLVHWDEYGALKERIKSDLLDQIERLKTERTSPGKGTAEAAGKAGAGRSQGSTSHKAENNALGIPTAPNTVDVAMTTLTNATEHRTERQGRA